MDWFSEFPNFQDFFGLVWKRNNSRLSQCWVKSFRKLVCSQTDVKNSLFCCYTPFVGVGVDWLKSKHHIKTGHFFTDDLIDLRINFCWLSLRELDNRNVFSSLQDWFIWWLKINSKLRNPWNVVIMVLFLSKTNKTIWRFSQILHLWVWKFMDFLERFLRRFCETLYQNTIVQQLVSQGVVKTWEC